MKAPLIALFLFGLASTAQGAVVKKEIQYKHGDVQLTGTYVYDDAAPKPMPGVVVIPEWWGLTDYARGRAEQLAGLGYAALAIDMYGTGVIAETPDKAKELSGPFYADPSLMRGRAGVGLDVLKAQPEVDPARIGVIGYCFGGTAALELARAGADVKGVVSFHGGLETKALAKPGTVRAQVLALNGGADPFVPPAQKDAFAKEMTASGVTFKSIDYPGATHAFTNPEATERGKQFNMPIAYDPDADRQSFEEMKAFFARLFK